MSSSTESFQETFRNDEVVIALHKAVSTALHTPKLGGTLTLGAKIHNLATKRRLRPQIQK